MQSTDSPEHESTAALWRVALIVLGVICGMLMLGALLLPQQGGARETARGNTCRSNLRACATAVFQYQNDNGKYPGYLNVLPRTDKAPYVDPDTGRVTPVSWAVMILPYVDRRATFDQWRRSPGDAAAVAATSTAPSVGTAAATPAAPWNRRQYFEIFLCPSDPQPSKTGAPISFVVNSGHLDLPAPAAMPSRMLRDHGGNGIFFDHFTEHALIKTTGPRASIEYLSDASIQDPHAVTILLTENLDAVEYVFDPTTHAADNWRASEVQTGCIWRPGPIDKTKQPPRMTPPVESLKINRDRGKGDGFNFDYCRPSSHHPQSVNIAFVGQNVAMLRDDIDYYVYAKLMSPDDEHAGDASLDATFRTHTLTEADLSP